MKQMANFPILQSSSAVFDRRISFVCLSLLLLSACSRDPQARADTTADSQRVGTTGLSKRDSAAGYVVDTPIPQGVPTKRDTSRATRDSLATDSTRRDTSSSRDSLATRTDSTASDSTAAPALSVKMAPGRPKKDSLALIYVLRKANRSSGWPVRGAAPAPGALLPDKRIIAFYGNPLSKRMGILGEIPPEKMLAKLDTVVKEWEQADPETPVQPALHYISVVAQAGPGRDGKYRLRMDSSKIEEVYGWAKKRNAVLFVDIQTGLSTVADEMRPLMKFLERPDVHFAIDPEFHMHYDREGVPPGKKIGTLTAKEINYAIDQLSKLVKEKNLPPKVLVIHRFTRPMVRDYKAIKLDPNVQVVLHMDGWGAPWLKFDSYKDYIVDEPVQYTGFKLFYKNDTKRGDKLLTAAELVQLKPRPIYIQYQ
jgi:hypothetical protein